MSPVPGDQIVGRHCRRTLQDTVVRVVARDHFAEPLGLNDGSCIPQRLDSLRRALLEPAKLAHKHPGNFLQDEGGQVQLKAAPPSKVENETLIAGEVSPDTITFVSRTTLNTGSR